MINILTKLFGKPEEINGLERCPTYLYRWQILKLGEYKLYLHKFVGNDWCIDLHDHPRRFISIGLKGSYNEINEKGIKLYKAPWIRTFPAEHKHRLETLIKPTWTLVLVCRITRKWGFWHEGIWRHWKEFVNSNDADKMKSC